MAEEENISYQVGNVGSPAIPAPSFGYTTEQKEALAQLRENELEEATMAELARLERLIKKKGGSTRKTRRSRSRK